MSRKPVKPTKAVFDQAKQTVENQVNVAGDLIVHGTTPAPDQAAARRGYLRELARCCRLLPMTDLGHNHGLTRSITLDQVYIELLTTTPRKKKQTKKGKEDFPRQEEPLSARDVAARDPAFVLLGDPGSGKSSFVKELAAALADAELAGGPPVAGFAGNPLPLLVELRSLVGHLTRADLTGLGTLDRQTALAGLVKDYLIANLTALDSAAFAPGVQDALNGQACLLILDGLDEVAEAHRPLVREAAVAVLARYRLPHLIVTCRRRSYDGQAAFPDLPVHTLAPLDEAQVQHFCGAWYQAQATLGNLKPEDDPGQLGESLAQAAFADPKLLELATNPMLLTSMAIVHQQNRTLPKERAAVYDRAIQVLLTKWPKGKGQTGTAPSPALAALLDREIELLRLMRRLAFRAHESNEGRSGEGTDEAGDLTRQDALAVLEGELRDLALAGEFLDYVDQRAGLLVGRGGGGGIPSTYAFAHRTFQEFLAGCELVARKGIKGIRSKLEGGDYWYLAIQFGIEHCLFNETSALVLIEHFPESLCLSSGPRNQAAWRGHLLAAHQTFLAGADRADPALVKRLRKRLCAILAQERLPSPIERAEAGRHLARLGDPRFRPEHYGLPDDPGWGFVEVSAGLCRPADDKPQIEVDGFLIGKWPVTNAQYQVFVDDDGYRNPAWWSEARAAGCWDGKGFHLDRPQREAITKPVALSEPYSLPNHPVVSVSWYEASAYCAWLTDRLRRDPRAPVELARLLSSGWTVRLPAGAEWVRAARGDTGREFPWGDEADPNRMNCREAGIGSTSAVGCFPGGASLAFPGVEELSGNVWEWCADADGTERVMRGGSYWFNAWNCRSASRFRFEPGFRFRFLGFRVAAGQGVGSGAAASGATGGAEEGADAPGSRDATSAARPARGAIRRKRSELEPDSSRSEDS